MWPLTQDRNILSPSQVQRLHQEVGKVALTNLQTRLEIMKKPKNSRGLSGGPKWPRTSQKRAERPECLSLQLLLLSRQQKEAMQERQAHQGEAGHGGQTLRKALWGFLKAAEVRLWSHSPTTGCTQQTQTTLVRCLRWRCSKQPKSGAAKMPIVRMARM